jgi:NADH:ubiquinone oxidoreductase subunit 5 (subunit L)/multisubunit Na+/H+ antiporter MnhA subunit
VGALVLLYCRWYFDGKTQGVGLFAAVLLGFAGAMYGLVLTDDIIVLVMFWEITSILSYLLIGFYHARREPSSRPAGAARDDARRPRDVRRRRHARR